MAEKKRVGWLFLFLFFVFRAPEAQDDAATWLEDAHGCKFLAFTKRPPPQQLQWDGACVDGYLSGPGTANFGPVVYKGEFKRGSMESGEVRHAAGTYKGAFRGNTPHGRGTWTFTDGTVIEGENVNGVPTGMVDIAYPDGSRYRGEVKRVGPADFQRHGRGRSVQANGNIYEGEFQLGKAHGQGTLTSAGGATYKGEFAFGHYNGKGVLEGSDGSRYEGDFVDNKHQGHGTLRYADGAVYVGQFAESVRQGKGRLEEADGTVYEGDWKSNELNGACTIKTAVGTSYSGECQDGKRSGHGRFEDPANGVVYDGEYRNGRLHGRGRLEEPGYVYEGSFLAGVRSGHGREVYETGEQYEGEFLQGQRSGLGLLRTPRFSSEEASYEGDFKKGVPEGNGTLRIAGSMMTGEFVAGRFVRGRVSDSSDRIIEVDLDAQTFFQVLPNGTKVPIDVADLHLPDL